MARKRFALELIKKEIKPFSKIAPVAGFFTYGEFFSDNKAIFLNQTMTVLALSENKNISKTLINNNNNNDDYNIKALWNLIEATSKDYEKVNTLLEEIIEKKSNNLKNVEDHYTKILSMMNEGILILNKDFKLQKINNAFLQITKCNECEKCSKCKKVDKYINDFLPNFFQKYNEKQKSFETILITKEGEKEVFINISKIKNQYIISVSDLSELKKQERQLIEQSKLAQMGEMINMIAHQWRQPLNTLNAIAITLEMKSSLNILEAKEIEQQAQKIQEVSVRMSKVIDDFLNFAKNSSKQTNFLINEIIEEVLVLIKPQLTLHSIELIIDIKNNININSYKSDLMHIILNILSNAKDALDESKTDNKKIYLKSYIKENLLFIEIEDNAGGIPKHIINRIFEPYFSTKGNKGTGLGLYMSKKMAIERLQGNISVENSKKGAKFIIEIPI